jgi:hypothetical protein
MKKMRTTFLRILFLPFLLFACGGDEFEDTVSFSRILEDGDYSVAYYPVGIRETSDGGTLILAGKNVDPESYPQVVVIKTDE